MITNGFFKTIYLYQQAMVVFDLASEGYTFGGEYGETYSSGIEQFYPVPMTAQLLKYFPAGAYTHEDYKFVQIGSGMHETRSVILYNNNQYRIDKVFDRSNEGGFTEYMTKRITDILTIV